MDKVHLYCVLRNEAHMLPYFFRHYDQFVDKYFMWDDDSDDGSREIISANPKAILIPCIENGLDDIYFSKIYSDEYKIRSRNQAEWIFAVAVDEFIYHPELIWELEKAKAQAFGVLQCRGYQMLSSQFPTTSGQIYDEVNKGIYDPRYSIAVVFQPSMDVSFSPGRESTKFAGMKPSVSKLRLLHFRFLSEEYVKERHARNWSRLTEKNRSAGLGTHTDPNYKGQYDLNWYKQSLMEAKPCLIGE